MKIKKDNTIADVLVAFNKEYPLLKLAMYRKAHEHNEGTKAKYELPQETLLADINPNLNDGMIQLHDDLTVEALEDTFENDYGLHVQVFRKSGDIWLQTSATDHWTLKKHLEHAH